MPKAIDEALDRDKRERERRLSELQLGPDATSLTLLQAIYRSPDIPLSTRMRAAGMALQFEHPKLGVSVSVPWTDEFALRLEQAVERSSRVIEHKATPPKVIEHSATEQSPLSVVIGPAPDRRFRRA
jgi:hypothetical protein